MADPTDDPARPDEAADRVRRRLDEVFGEVLPEVTRDEVDESPDERSGPRRDDWRSDDWLRANRPPHHDDGG